VCTLPEQAVNTTLGAPSLRILIQRVLGKPGMTLIPEMALVQPISRHDKLAAVHLNQPGPHRCIAFVVRPNVTRTSTIEALIEVCQKLTCEKGKVVKARL